MSTITTIAGTDQITNSRAVINTNFSNLNTDKEETTNKSTNVVTDQASNTKFPSVKSVYDWAIGLFATISNLALKAPLANPTFTGTVSGITASMVGLGNVDNTSDATKNSATATLTNKRITKRVETVASSATPASNTDSYDETKITGLAVAITSLTTNLTGTPVDGDLHLWSFTDNGTARAITPGASFENSTVSFPTTTVISTKLDVLCKWNTATSKWRVIATS